jgi:hypothetical protein
MRPGILSALAGAPAIALAVMSVVWTAARPFGGGLWPPDEVTLAEAAAMGSEAEVLRLVALGVSPNVRATVRPGLLDNREHRVTPFEAAVAARLPGTAALLLQLGARPTAAHVTALRCDERRSPSPEIRVMLDGLARDAPLECP